MKNSRQEKVIVEASRRPSRSIMSLWAARCARVAVVASLFPLVAPSPGAGISLRCSGSIDRGGQESWHGQLEADPGARAFKGEVRIGKPGMATGAGSLKLNGNLEG